MGTIRVLEEIVASQIAAGEVVERPASVVKELVENALDAGAARIEVEVEGGGADRIRVSDDGSGMEGDDARLAFERHATSKIRSASDLQAIATYGFRGEALPSIASVSRTTLTTSPGGSGGGTRVRIACGAVVSVEPAPHPRGTTVEVEALFESTPARRKFLRTRATETGRVADLLARLAVANPGVSFVMKSGGRALASWPAVPGLGERVAQLLGPEESRALVDVDRREGGMRLRGLASSPSLQRTTSRDEHLFVNGRPIQDRRLLHAVQEAYVTLLPRGRFPVLYLFLEIPATEVDVNVHPAKAEVRFLRASAVHGLVRDALAAALGASRPFARYEMAPRLDAARHGNVWGPQAGGPGVPHALAEPSPPPPGGTSRLQAGREDPLIDSVPIAPLAQFRESYILASAPDGLVILDQHAAHERVLYERYLAQSRAGRIERQRLLFPLTLDLSPSRRLAFEAAAASLEELGFGLSPFGDDTLRVDEVPALVGSADPARLVQGLLDELLEWSKAEGIERLRHRVVASAACHAAVTANQPLDGARMRQLVSDLMRTEHPMTCPHGRPALLRLGLDQLEREFRRR